MAKHFSESHPGQPVVPLVVPRITIPHREFYCHHCLKTFGPNFHMLIDHGFICPAVIAAPSPARAPPGN
ncbi:hypothetical protein Tco_0757211 [Tanacetum coccineum]